MNAFVCILAIVGATTAYKPQGGWQSPDGSDGKNGWQPIPGKGWQGDSWQVDPVEPKPWKTGGVDPQPWQINPVVPKPWKAIPVDPKPWKVVPVDPKPWKSVPVDPKPWKGVPVDPKPWKLVQTTETPKGWEDGADDSAWAYQGVGKSAAYKKGKWQPEPTATAGPVEPWQYKPQPTPWKSAGDDGASSAWKNDDYPQKEWEQDDDNEVPVSGWKPESDGNDAWKVKQWKVPSTVKPWKYDTATKGPWKSGPWIAPTPAKPTKPIKEWKKPSKWY